MYKDKELRQKKEDKQRRIWKLKRKKMMKLKLKKNRNQSRREIVSKIQTDLDGFKEALINSKNRKALLDKFFSEEYYKNAFSLWYLRFQKIIRKDGNILFMTVKNRWRL